MAGVSVDYYTRLEQGRARNVSAQVLDALAQALKLDAVERDYLYALAHPAGTPAADAPSAKASAGVRAMVDALDPTPALLHGPFLEVLAVNRMGARLFADFMAMPVHERNLARWTFLDPRPRRVPAVGCGGAADGGDPAAGGRHPRRQSTTGRARRRTDRRIARLRPLVGRPPGSSATPTGRRPSTTSW